MDFTPKPGINPELYLRDQKAIQELIKKLSQVNTNDVDSLKTLISTSGGEMLDLQTLLDLIGDKLGMDDDTVKNLVVEFDGFSDEFDKSNDAGRQKIATLLQHLIDTAKPDSNLTSTPEGSQKAVLGTQILLKSFVELKKGVDDVDKSMNTAKSSFANIGEVMGSTVDRFQNSMDQTSAALTQSSARLGAVTSETSGYLNGFTTVLKSGSSGLLAPLAMLGGAAAMAGIAIGNFQKKLDIGRSYGSASGGETMVEQLRQMHVTSLIDPAALNDLSQVMSKSFNVGLGMNQKEMTRVATKQRLSERVMGKEYADNQMTAINDMKTVLAGQSPSGMMDDLTAQTSALAKTMGVSNKYALEQIKAIHSNSKALTKGMNSAGAKDVEATFAKMLAQNKAAGYTEEYSTKEMEQVTATTTDKGKMAEVIRKAIQIKAEGGAGGEAQAKLLAEANISYKEMQRVMNLAASVGVDAMTGEERDLLMQSVAIQKKSEEFATAEISNKLRDPNATEEEKNQARSRQMVQAESGYNTSNETANKTLKGVVGAREMAGEELALNRNSADAAPAIDKLLVTLQQQAGNSEKSKQELEAILTKNIMDANPDKKAEVAAAKEKKIQFGMKKSKMGRKEYMASLGASQKEALITKKAKDAGLSRGDFLATLDDAQKASLEAQGNTMAMNQLNFDSMTTVMGKDITKTVGDMEKGVKGASIGGVKGSNLKAVVQNPDYENNRVKLVSNPVENLADLANKKLIEANNAMERGIMKLVNKAIPYLMSALNMLADNIKEIAAGAILLLGGIFAYKTIMAIGSGIGLLSRIFGKVRMGAISTGAFSIKNIFSKLGSSLKGIYNTFVKISDGFLKIAKAPFKIIKAIKNGIINTVEAVPTVIKAIKNVPTSVSNGVKKIANVPGAIKQKVLSSVKNVKTNIVAKSLTKDADQLKKVARAEALARRLKLAGNLKGAKAATKLATKMKDGLSITTKLAKATSIASKVTTVGAGALGAAGTAFTKFLGPVGIAVTVARAGKAAFDGWNNASKVFGVEMATGSQKFSSALGGIVSSLSMGMIDATASAKWFDTNFGNIWAGIAKMWDNIVANAKKFWEDVKALFGPSFESLGEVFDDFIAMVISPFKAIMSLFVGDTKGAKDALSEAFNGFIGLFKSIPKFLGDSFGAIFDTILELGDKIAWQFTKMMWAVLDLWNDFDFDRDVIVPISEMLSAGWSALSAWVKNIHFMELVIDPLVKTITDAISSMYISIVKHLPTMMTDYLGEDTKKKIKAAKAQDAYEEKNKEEIGKQKAISDGKTGEALLDQLAKYDLGDSDQGLGFTGGVKKEAMSYLSDEQLKSLMDGDKKDDYQLDDKTKKLLRAAIISRENGNTHQKTTVAGKSVIVGSTNKIDAIGTTKNKDGLKTLKSYDSFKDKTSTEIKKFLKENRSELSKESRTRLIAMVDDNKRDTDRVKAAKEKTKQRKKERADKNKTRKNIEVKEGSDSAEIAAAKVSVGASGSDTIIQKAKDGLSSFGDSISSTFDSIMGKSNTIARDGFGNVVASIKGTNYFGGTASPSSGPVMSNNSLATVRTNKNMDMSLGSVSAKYESNGGAGTISSGRGDKGGVSYGMYQMKSEGKNGGVVGSFIKTLPAELKKAFQDSSGKQYAINSSEFKKAWKETAKGKDKKQFAKKQHEYIKKTHYDVQSKKVKDETGVDISKRSKALQNVAWSTSVQHGGNTNVITKALEQLKKDGKKDTDENLIKAIYAERGKSAKKGGLARFGGSDEKTNRNVKKRFNSEEKQALSMLKTEQAIKLYGKDAIPVQTDTSSVTQAVKDQAASNSTPNTNTSSDGSLGGEKIDFDALNGNIDVIMQNLDKTHTKQRQELLDGLASNNKDGMTATMQTQSLLATLLGKSQEEQDKLWKGMDAAKKKQIMDAYKLLEKQKKAQKEAQKTQNGNGSTNNKDSNASATKEATDATKKSLVSQTEGSQMAKDLAGGLNTDQQKEAEAKFKELGIDMKWAAEKAFSIGTGQTGDSEVDLKKMEQVKNVLALIKGTKTEKQVALEQGHDKRMTNVGNTFADKKMKAIGEEDLTGDVDFNKKKADLQTKLDAAKKAAMKSGNRDEVMKIQAEQKALAETDAGKADKKLDGKRKIKKLMDEGKTKEAREATKKEYKEDYDTHMTLEEKSYIDDVSKEEQIANGKKKVVEVPTKKVLPTKGLTPLPEETEKIKQKANILGVDALSDKEKSILVKTASATTTPTNGNSGTEVKKVIDTSKKKAYKPLKHDDPLMIKHSEAVAKNDKVRRKAAKGTLVETMYNITDAKSKIYKKYKPGKRRSKEDIVELGRLKGQERNLRRNKNYKEQARAVQGSKAVLESQLVIDESRIKMQEKTGQKFSRGDITADERQNTANKTRSKLAALPNTPEASKVRDMKNVEVQKARATIQSATANAKASGGGIDAQEKIDLSKMEALLTQILSANTTQAKQATTQNALTKAGNDIKARSHQMDVNKTGQ